jgi:gamma-glutamyltranspeptidase/glutathione hydrolase
MIVGSPGGRDISRYVTKTIVGMLDWKLNIRDAVDTDNSGAQTSATTRLERGSPNQNLRAGLEARGHTVSVGDIDSGIHGIVFDGKRDNGRRDGLFAMVKPRSG